jgi:hypothetical protein
VWGITKIIEKLRYGTDPSDQQMIAGASARDVEQVPLGVIYLLQISVVTYRFDTFLQGYYFVVAGHHGHSSHGAFKCVGIAGN